MMGEFLAFIIAWVLFYYVLTYHQKRAAAIKATIIAFLFMGIFYSIMTNMRTRLEHTQATPVEVQHSSSGRV